MNSLVWRLLVVIVLLGACCGTPATAAPTKGKAKAPVAKEVCVTRIHIIKGCGVCETMVSWLTQGGVKLNIKSIDRGEFPTYPTVVYSDGKRDHGDRMYSRNAGIPEAIDVVSCESVGG